jgi:integrase
MGRSVKPSVYIQTRRGRTGYKTYRVRREVGGRELPSIACGPDKALAERVRDEWKSKLWHRRLRVPAPTDALTVAQFVELDRARREVRFAPSTLEIERRALDYFVEYFGAGPLSSVGRESVHGFEVWLRGQKWQRTPGGTARARSTNGILIYLRALKAALRRAVKEGYLDADPFFGYEMPPEEDVANPPTRDGVRAMWEHLSPLARCALAVDLALGLRRGEILRISRASLQPPARDRAHWLVTVQKSKTRRGKVEHKTMALPAVALAALETLQPWPATGPLLRVHPSTLSHAIADAARAAGLGRVRLHDLRHRWATELMQRCKDEYALMDVGGWTTRAAVKRYQHPTPARRDVTLQVEVDLPPALPTDAGEGKAGKRESSTKKGR